MKEKIIEALKIKLNVSVTIDEEIIGVDNYWFINLDFLSKTITISIGFESENDMTKTTYSCKEFIKANCEEKPMQLPYSIIKLIQDIIEN